MDIQWKWRRYLLSITIAAALFGACSNHIADNDGKVVVGPYPVKNDIANLKAHGITKIVSLLDSSNAYEDTLLKREEAYARTYGLAFQNFSLTSDSSKTSTPEYQQGAQSAASAIATDNGKIYLHSYLTSTRTQSVEQLLRQNGIMVATYTLPRRAGSELTYALDSAESAYQASHFQTVLDILGHRRDLDRRSQLLLAWATYHLNRTDEAKREFDSVLTQHPDETEAKLGIAYCDYREHNLPQADSLFGVCLSQHPNDPSANAGMGLVRYEEGKLDDARKYLSTSLRTDSINVEAGELLLRIDSADKHTQIATGTRRQ